jgi:prophage antirepressor-like protein
MAWEFNKSAGLIALGGKRLEILTFEKTPGVPWFKGNDAASLLDYSDPRRAIAAHVEDEHKRSLGDLIEQFGAAQGGGAKCTTSSKHNDLLTSYINEAGLYDLVLLSKKPEARAFRKWLVEEVIPQIRASGSYVERGSQPHTHNPVLTIQRPTQVTVDTIYNTLNPSVAAWVRGRQEVIGMADIEGTNAVYLMLVMLRGSSQCFIKWGRTDDFVRRNSDHSNNCAANVTLSVVPAPDMCKVEKSFGDRLFIMNVRRARSVIVGGVAYKEIWPYDPTIDLQLLVNVLQSCADKVNQKSEQVLRMQTLGLEIEHMKLQLRMRGETPEGPPALQSLPTSTESRSVSHQEAGSSALHELMREYDSSDESECEHQDANAMCMTEHDSSDESEFELQDANAVCNIQYEHEEESEVFEPDTGCEDEVINQVPDGVLHFPDHHTAITALPRRADRPADKVLTQTEREEESRFRGRVIAFVREKCILGEDQTKKRDVRSERFFVGKSTIYEAFKLFMGNVAVNRAWLNHVLLEIPGVTLDFRPRDKPRTAERKQCTQAKLTFIGIRLRDMPLTELQHKVKAFVEQACQFDRDTNLGLTTKSSMITAFSHFTGQTWSTQAVNQTLLQMDFKIVKHTKKGERAWQGLALRPGFSEMIERMCDERRARLRTQQAEQARQAALARTDAEREALRQERDSFDAKVAEFVSAKCELGVDEDPCPRRKTNRFHVTKYTLWRAFKEFMLDVPINRAKFSESVCRIPGVCQKFRPYHKNRPAGQPKVSQTQSLENFVNIRLKDMPLSDLAEKIRQFAARHIFRIVGELTRLTDLYDSFTAFTGEDWAAFAVNQELMQLDFIIRDDCWLDVALRI